MTFTTHNLVLGTVAFAVGFTACGGGRVVVNTPAPSAVVASVPTTPAPSGFVVSTVPPRPAPPVLNPEVAPSPGPDYIRVEGYYNWLGDHYEWVPATWVKIPHPGATYIPGHWQSTASGYVWTPGYWQ